jgi:hypothetical protein
VSEPYNLYELAPLDFIENNPNVKVMSRADACRLPSHAALGSPILRNAPNDSTSTFLQVSPLNKDPFIGVKAGEITSDTPHDMFPGDYERYNHVHFHDPDLKPDTINFKIGEANYKAHNRSFGQYYTTQDGTLIAPPLNSELYNKNLNHFYQEKPHFARSDPRYMGLPLAAVRTTTIQPRTNYVSYENNPWHYINGAFLEVQPHPEHPVNEQFLIAMDKLSEPFNKRFALQGDQKWFEPPVPTGFGQRAKHSQGLQTPNSIADPSVVVPPVDTLETQVTTLVNGKKVTATSIKPGLRGGGDTAIPSYVLNPVDLFDAKDPSHKIKDFERKGYSSLSGVLLPPHADIFKQRPYVTLHDGTLEPIFPPLTIRRIANDSKKGARPIQIFGGYFGQVSSINNWITTPRFTCTGCGSFYHGMKDCPLLYLTEFKVHCNHCERDGHYQYECPYPLQIMPRRTIVQSVISYTGTLHFKHSLLVWYYELGAFDEKKFNAARKQIRGDALMGESKHAFTTIPCSDCSPIDHQVGFKNAVDVCAARLREKGTVENLLIPGAWYIDRRLCPLYWRIYNINFRNVEFTAYNPNRIVALDALYRIFLRCQGWHIKTPVCSTHNT